MSDPNDKMLDDLFADVRRSTPDVDAAFLARVLSDAEAAQPKAEAALERGPVPRNSWWSQLVGQIGGWPAVAGLASAAVTGLWIGISPPEVVGTNVATLFGVEDTLDAFSSTSDFNFLQFEG